MDGRNLVPGIDARAIRVQRSIPDDCGAFEQGSDSGRRAAGGAVTRRARRATDRPRVRSAVDPTCSCGESAEPP